VELEGGGPLGEIPGPCERRIRACRAVVSERVATIVGHRNGRGASPCKKPRFALDGSLVAWREREEGEKMKAAEPRAPHAGSSCLISSLRGPVLNVWAL
jgi:hypothetical protein